MNHQSVIELIGAIGDLLDYDVFYEKDNMDVMFIDQLGKKYIFQVEDTNHNNQIILNYKNAKELNPEKFMHVFLKKSSIFDVLKSDENTRIFYFNNRINLGINELKINKKNNLNDLNINPYQKDSLFRLYKYIEENSPFISIQELCDKFSKYQGKSNHKTTHKYFSILKQLGLIKTESKNNWQIKILGVNPISD